MEEKKYYSKDIEEVYKQFKTSQKGITDTEAVKRLEQNGPNKLKEAKKKTMLSRFIDQFKNIMIVILIIAAILSAIVGIQNGEGITDSIIIFVVIFLNAILGVVQESKAEAAIDALKKMSVPFIKVRRNGKVESIKTEDIVCGDIVLVEAGDFIPADMRIIESASLTVEESALTGESLPVHKQIDVISEKTPLAERTNMLYSGSSVAYGRGEGIVVATGMDTEIGKIASALNNEKEGLTPLQRKIDEISKILSIIVVIIAVIMLVVGRVKGDDLMSTFMMAISLAVAAIPEGLVAVITITLAIGVQKMAKENATIRKMSSVETLGCTQIICSDKTGTLTQNKMTVKRIYLNQKEYFVDDLTYKKEVDDVTMTEFANILTLCNDSKPSFEDNKNIFLGDPTETALVYFTEELNFSKEALEKENKRVAEVPFESERKMMSTINKFGDEYKVFTKGAVESILARCTSILENGTIQTLTEEKKNEIIKVNSNMADNAIRVLATAYKKIKQIPDEVTSATVETDLVYVGLVGMIDPPRKEAKDAVKKCYEAGMIPVMITGDNKQTAMAIAKDLGILENEEQATTGEELDKLSDEEFAKKVLDYRVYARVSPDNKIRIVKAWQAHDKIVAMTGDGVNDAPALKGADIGVGMGITGTEVSKSVSSMILTDDNFATIVSAVKEGRKIYKNIQNVIVYLLASNLAEVLIIFFATLFGHHILLPIQLLWINLISDSLPALALGCEEADKNIMKQKPRSAKESFFNPFLSARVIVPSILKAAIILGIYFYELSVSGSSVLATTMAFMTLALEETLYAMVCRSDRKLIIKQGITKNKVMLATVVSTIVLQYAIILIKPLADMFKLQQLSLTQHLIVIGTAVFAMLVSELIKVILAKIFLKEEKTK